MKRKFEKDKCYRSTVRLICNSQMAKELNRCFDYDRYCWNKMLEMSITYQKDHNGLFEPASNRTKRFRAIRNSEEWQLKLPEYIVDTVSIKLVNSISKVVEHNKKIKFGKICGRYWKLKFKSKKADKNSFYVKKDRILTGSYKPKGKNFTFGIVLTRKSVVHPKYRMMEITELPKGLKEGTARIVGATILKRRGEYYVSFCMEILKPKTYYQATGTIGIDPGLKTTLTLSNGVKISYPKKIKMLSSKAEYYQSRMDKRYVKSKKIQSKRYYSARTKFWRTLKRIANLKKDWIHKVTTKLAKTYRTIKWEDVEPEKMVKAKKKNLAKAIGRASWGTIRRILENKLKARQGVLILVPC